MSTGRRAALVAVGDELLSGVQADGNSAWLARELAAIGLPVASVELVSDDEPAIAEAVLRACARAELVLVGGGLGPTLDDVTRHGIARAFARELLESPQVVAELQAWFAARAVPMSASNRRQALFPAGARVLENHAGTAPGFLLEQDGRAVLALPGPPRELHVMWQAQVLPWLRARGWAGEPLAERHFYLFGLPESLFAERAGEWMARDAEPRMGCTVRDGTLTASMRASAHTDAALAALAARAEEFRRRFAAEIYSTSEWDVECVLGRALLARGITVSLAESCTGGLALALLTRVAGISGVLAQGFVTYSDEAKVRTLGVPRELLEAHGAVSQQVAGAMALGAARVSGSRLALAITGIAGPQGGSAEKPVGLVCFASALDGVVHTSERRFPPGERDFIRRMAARAALHQGWVRLRAAGAAD